MLSYYFNFQKNCDGFKSNSPCILLNKNINFNKNEKESKIENLTHSFRETNLVLQLIWASQIKSKIMISCSLRKKNKCIICTIYFVRKKFFNICVLSQCILYWIHFQNIHTFKYQIILNNIKRNIKYQILINCTLSYTLPYIFFGLFLKLSKPFRVSLWIEEYRAFAQRHQHRFLIITFSFNISAYFSYTKNMSF